MSNLEPLWLSLRPRGAGGSGHQASPLSSEGPASGRSRDLARAGGGPFTPEAPQPDKGRGRSFHRMSWDRADPSRVPEQQDRGGAEARGCDTGPGRRPPSPLMLGTTRVL